MADGQLNNYKLMKKVFIINFLLIITIIIILELIFNIFKLSNLMGIKSGLIYKENKSHYLYPNKTGKIFNEKVFTDKFSFRVPEISFKYLNDKNIYIIGDSVAFGNGVKEQNTFVGLLRIKYDKKNFLNSSVPGYQIKDHVINIPKVKNFKNVEKIIYFFTLNDIYQTSNILDINNQDNSDEGSYYLRDFKIIEKLNLYLRDKSYLYMFIKGIGTDPSKRWFSNVLNEYKNKKLDYFKKDIEIMKTFSDENNSEFYVIILPYEFQTRNCSNNILLPQKNIIEILSKSNINFMDFTKNFCDQKKPKKLFYKFDPMHLSKDGHMLVFNLLNDKINF